MRPHDLGNGQAFIIVVGYLANGLEGAIVLVSTGCLGVCARSTFGIVEYH